MSCSWKRCWPSPTPWGRIYHTNVLLTFQLVVLLPGENVQAVWSCLLFFFFILMYKVSDFTMHWYKLHEKRREPYCLNPQHLEKSLIYSKCLINVHWMKKKTEKDHDYIFWNNSFHAWIYSTLIEGYLMSHAV